MDSPNIDNEKQKRIDKVNQEATQVIQKIMEAHNNKKVLKLSKYDNSLLIMVLARVGIIEYNEKTQGEENA